MSSYEELDQIRGSFLSAIIAVEDHLDRTLAYFYAPDELSIFRQGVLKRLPLEAKLANLKLMLQHVGLWPKHKKVWSEIDDLRNHRNEFAHLGIEFSGHRSWGKVYLKPSLDLGAPEEEEEIDLEALRDLVRRAKEVEPRTLEVAKEITAAHKVPSGFFERPGWDPGQALTAP